MSHALTKRLGVGVDNREESRLLRQPEKVPGNLEARETSGKNIQGEGTAGTKTPPQCSPNLSSLMPTGKDSTRGLRNSAYELQSFVPLNFCVAVTITSTLYALRVSTVKGTPGRGSTGGIPSGFLLSKPLTS